MIRAGCRVGTHGKEGQGLKGICALPVPGVAVLGRAKFAWDLTHFRAQCDRTRCVVRKRCIPRPLSTRKTHLTAEDDCAPVAGLASAAVRPGGL